MRSVRDTANVSDSLRFELALAAGFACAYCLVKFGSVVTRPGRGDALTRLEADHVIPVSWTGREYDRPNLVAACQVCNNLKNATVFDSITNARRFIDREWVRCHYAVVWSPTRSNFEDPEGWAMEYSRYMRAIGVIAT